MSEKKYTWHKVAESEKEIHFTGNGIAVMEINGKAIAITKFEENWFAFTSKCPHAGGLLSDGYIDAIGNVVCPLHRYKFNIKNGRNSSGEGYVLKTYPLQLNEDGIFIGLEETGFLKWF